MSNTLLLNQNDKTLLISINRPKIYNALNKETKIELTQIFNKVSKDKTVNSVILTGVGKAFCTGQDLNDRQKMNNPDLGITLEQEWNPLINSMRTCKKIIISAINGVCAGAGVSLALTCDLIVASPQVSFVSAFTKLGLIPDSGATSLLTKTIGPKRALDFLLLPNKKNAQTFFDWGLINRLDNDPLLHAKELAKVINQLAPLSCQHLKQNIISAMDLNFSDSIQTEVNSQRTLGKSHDFQEGILSFFEKRPSQFKGE